MKHFLVTSILVPTDLSESSVPALRYARLIGDRFSAKITVIHADPLVYPFDVIGPVDGFYVKPTPTHDALLRGEVAQHAGPEMAGRSYDIIVGVGQPIPSILSAAKDRKADLIVMGSHLKRGLERALLGSVSNGVLHGSACPVLTASANVLSGEPGRAAITNIVCPVTFSDVARETLEIAADLAGSFGSRLTLVHVAEDDDPVQGSAAEETFRSWVPQAVLPLCSYRQLTERGPIAERVLDFADDLESDLLVVGAQHRRFREASVLGTTTEHLLRFASSPVLVVPRAFASDSAQTGEMSEVSSGAVRY